MTSRPWRRAKSVAWLLLVWGCHHEGDSAIPAPPAASEVDGAPTEGPPPTDAPLEASAPVASTDSHAPDASTSPAPPAPNPLDNAAAPAYPPSALYDAFSKAKPKLIACYLPGKKKDPKLRGKVIVKFTIHSDGTAKPVANEGSTLEDDDVIACVIRVVRTIRFTKPIEGSATVIYPLIFRPTGDETLLLPDTGSKVP
jgi:hypothetical protein